MRALTITLLRDNEKLVASIANKMSRRYSYPDVEDLIGEGRSILLDKAHSWDPARGKFTTFATWVLRNGLLDYLKRQKKMVLSDQIDECVPDTRCRDALPSRLHDLWEGLSEAGREVLHVCLTTDFGDVFGRVHDHQSALSVLRWEMGVRGQNDKITEQAFDEIRGLIQEGW